MHIREIKMIYKSHTYAHRSEPTLERAEWDKPEKEHTELALEYENI